MTKLKPSCRYQDQRINQSCEAGLVQHCSRSIASRCDHCQPSWGSDKTHAKWKLGTAEENAFQAVKRQLTQAPFMALFKQGAETRVITDASPIGIGAVLEQKQEDGQYRPVHYASRNLTSPESRHQTDRNNMRAP